MKNVLWLILLFVLVDSQAQEYSYVWANQYPAIAEPPIDCCYDFDGDTVLDNRNGNLMASLESLLMEDFQQTADQLIIDNQWVRVLRWDQLPTNDGPVTLNILTGILDNPLLDLNDRIDGETQITIDPGTLSTFTGTMTAGEIDLFSPRTAHAFLLPLFTTAGGSSSVVLLPLNDVRLRGTLIQNTTDCEGVCSEVLVGTDPITLGGMQLSGLLHHADAFDAINDQAALCSCAGIDPQTPLLDYLEDDSSLTVSCNYDNINVKGCDQSDGTFCLSLDNQCSFASLQSINFDQDTNGNGVADSQSVGGLIGFLKPTSPD